MAITTNNDVLIYNELAQTAYLERLQENLAVFNKASNNAILLSDENLQGDFTKESFYKIAGEIEHRDVNSTSVVQAKKIAMAERVGVKVPFKFGPYETTEEAFKRRARSAAEFSLLMGQEYAEQFKAGRWQNATPGLLGA